MKKPSLVSIGSVSLVFAAFLGVSTLWAQGHVAGNTTFGKVLPLPGHINAVAIDEARGLVYAGNFSAGRVEVVSMATHQRVSSFSTTPQPAAMVGMDMSLDSRFLVTLNAPVTSGVSQLSGVTAVNLNDPADRRHYPMVPELCTAAWTRTEPQGTWGPPKTWGKKVGWQRSRFASQPQGGHPHGYQTKTA